MMYDFDDTLDSFENDPDPLKFVQHLRAPEFHWFFVQGAKAIRTGLYVPGVSALLNGIEASLRVTIAQLEAEGSVDALSPYRVLSNNLIVNAQELSVPVSGLAFPGESEFFTKLATQKPNRIDVELVRQRNNICHGNVFNYVNSDLGIDNTFFTPECLRDLSDSLIEVSKQWSEELGGFRRSIGF